MNDDKVEIVSVVPVARSGRDTMPDAIDVTPLPMEDEEDPKVKIKAYDLFLNSTMDLDQIAVMLELPVKAVRTWARHGNWVSRKQDLMEVAIKASEQKMQAFIMEERVPTAQRHLRVAAKIEEAVEKTVADLTKPDKDGKETVAKPRDLKTIAEALSSAAGVSGRAVGITEAGVTGPDGAARKTPVVIINLSPTLSRQ